MPYTELEQLSGAEFKRLSGVSRNTFAEMALGVAPCFGTPRTAGWTSQAKR